MVNCEGVLIVTEDLGHCLDSIVVLVACIFAEGNPKCKALIGISRLGRRVFMQLAEGGKALCSCALNTVQVCVITTVAATALVCQATVNSLSLEMLHPLFLH